MFQHPVFVLLWKNLRLKRSLPWVTVFELATPVVLFVILVTLRLKEPVEKIGGTNYHPRPLPSSGMVAVLQEFCPHVDGRDVYGYPLHNNTSVEPFLDRLHHAWENSSVVGDGLNVSATLERFNQTWTNMTNNSDHLSNLFTNHTTNTLRFYDILKNKTEFQNYLVHNLSFTPMDASSLLNSTLNLKETIRMLQMYPLSSLPTPHRTKRSISDLVQVPLPKEPNIQALRKKMKLLAFPEQTSAAQPPYTEALLPLMNIALFSHPSLFSSNLSDVEKLQQKSRLSAIEAIILSPAGLRYMICDSHNTVLDAHHAVNASYVEEKKSRMCQEEDNREFVSLSNELLSQINNSAVLDAIANAQTKYENKKYEDNLNSILQDLEELQTLSKYIHSLVQITKFIPTNSCDSFDEAHTPINTTATTITTALYDNVTSFNVTEAHSTNARKGDRPAEDSANPRATKKQPKPDYLALWASVQPLICGTKKSSARSYYEHANASNIHLTLSQRHNLGILIHVLVSNPKILYAPNTTEVESIIQNANTSFAIIDNITKAGDTWRGASKNIRKALKDPKLDHTLSWIIQLQKAHKEHPALVNNLTAGQPELQRFLSSNVTLPNKTELSYQLDQIDNAACGWKKLVAGVSINWFKGFESEEAAVTYATQEAYEDKASVFATLIFQVDENGSLPSHVTYKIRQNASFTQPTTAIRLAYWRPDPYAWDFRYYTFGFVWLQDLIERSIMSEMVGRDVVSPGAYVHEMPYPCFKFDAFAMNLEHIMPLTMILSWVYTVAMFVQHIVYEKEQRLKEVMKIMGLSNGVHWLAWFISIFLQLEVTVTVISILLKFGKTAILPNSNFFIIWLFFSVYAAATIMFCFLVSVLFSKAKVASACSGIIYFMTYMPFAYMSIQEYMLHQSIPAMVKSAASLLSTTAFGLGAKYFALYELSGYGIQWDNMATTPVEGDTFSLLQALYMLIIDIFLYAFLTWYIEAVFPGQYGLPRSWYFPLTVSYWTGHSGTDADSCTPSRLWSHLTQPGHQSLTEDDQAQVMYLQSGADIEPEPTHLQLGVSIDKLTKVYQRGGKKAVDKLSVNFYENQITSFLGHNGAGKTTTMSILTGLFPPTSGTAYVYGSDIRHDMLNIRKSLGMCPQHNALFDVLTVEEHLWFYARLKGVSSTSLSKEMDGFLDDVGLLGKRDCKVDTLSGGMKRKLSVAIAFVGGSRTVILDEPTAGIDPYARRAIWDLIIKYKEGRTILLSTHHMDEADLLGDRVAIISNGTLQCCGSSLFLKSTYGDGYNLTLLKKLSGQSTNEVPSTEESSTRERPDKDKLTKFVHRHIPTALVTSDSSNQISFNLPFEAARKGCFHNLFGDLPDEMDDLKVTGYGLTDTTLEEVFLKVDTMARWDSEESSQGEKMKKIFPPRIKSNIKNHPTRRDSPPIADNSTNFDDDDDEPLINVKSTYFNISQSGEASSRSGVDTSDQACSSGSNGADADIALAWLNSAPSAPGQEEPTSSASNGEPVDEALLLDYAFGDSSFCSCSDASQPATRDHTPDQSSAPPGDNDEDESLLDLTEDLEGCASYKLSPIVHNLRIIQSLLAKRFHYARRSRKAVFYQIMLPALFVCIAMTIALSLPTPGDPPPLILSPSQYHNMTQPKGNFIPYSDQSVMFPVHRRKSKDQVVDAGTKEIIDTFSLASGVGATCVLKSNSTFNFDLDSMINSTASGNMKLVMKYFSPQCGASFTRGIPLSQFVPPVTPKVDDDLNFTLPLTKDAPCACSRDGNTYMCRKGYGEFPVTQRVVTGDKLIDVTGKEPIMPYLKYTTNDYRLHRYGAFSFGEVRKSVKQSFPGWPSPLRKIAVREAAQVYFNHKGFHSMATYLNVFNNALLRANLPPEKGNPATYGITAVNHPMNKTAGALSLDFLVSGTDVIIAIFIIVAMSFIPASFLVFLVAEKQSRAKHLQFISGTGPVTYWLANYIWDMLNYLFPAALCIMILQIFNLPAYTRGENAYAVVALFLLYGWSMTPMMYPASFYFNVPSTAYVCLIVINLFVGITTVVTTFMISLFNDDKRLIEVNEKLQIVFLIFPNYNLGKGLMDLSYHEYMNDYYRKIGEYGRIRSPFEWDIITRQLVAMGTEGVIGFLLTLLFEVRFFMRFSRGSKKSKLTYSTGALEDVDVANERHRVEQLRMRRKKDDLIIVDNITKVYNKHKGKTVAVDGLSFSVGRGECFGLLGVNGAGKTTTFQAVTGVREVTSGDIHVSGLRITGGRTSERLQGQQSTGYCPQFDALFNELTPIEHLLLYSRLRGVPPKDEERVVKWAISKLDLTSHKDKPVRNLSGGNKRKLSVAIALVGYPPVVLLDEPTAGMDPGARRFLWDLILDVTKSGRAVLLTSHSMEECEVLCNRIAIMVNGRFECVGPTQHLKNRFGDGYIVSIRSSHPERFVDVFKEEFPSAVLKEQHYHKAVFQLSFSKTNHSDASLAEVFKLLEERRDELKIEDYSVSQTTLDDVFINFAKKQRCTTVESNNFTARWKQRLLSWKEKSFSRGRRPSPLVERGTRVNDMTQRDLRLRGDPRLPDSQDSSLVDDLEADDEPLYNFNQDMLLSFLDSSC